MKSLLLWSAAFCCLFAGAGCVSDPIRAKGSANVTIQLDKVGALGKSGGAATIQMKDLVVTLRSPGEDTRRDTTKTLTGNAVQSVTKTFGNLTSKKTWTLEAFARDANGITIYRDSVKFTVPSEGTTDVNLELKAQYTMLRANFYPIRDSVNRCELWINGSLVDDSSFTKNSLPGDTLTLFRDYMTARDTGTLNTILMKVYGNWYGTVGALLYQGEATVRIYPGQTATYNVTLNWVAPLAPVGTGKINVTLGAIGTFSVGAYLDPRYWQYVATTGWYEFLSGGGKRFAMALSPTDVPHVAMRDLDNGGKVTVAKWNGEAWENVGPAAFSSGGAAHLSMAFSKSGAPYVAYQDLGNDKKATVMTWDGTSWTTVGGAAFSPSMASSLSLAVASDGKPWLAFRDSANNNGATVMRWNGNAWVTVGTAGFSQGAAASVAMAMTADDVPYVAFLDEANGSGATVMRWNGSAWEMVGTPNFSQGGIGEISLALSGGTPYVGFSASTAGLSASVMKWTGSGWSYVGPSRISTSTALNLSLALSKDGSPYLAFSDYTQSYAAAVVKWNGSRWEGTGVTAITTAPTGFFFLAFTTGDMPVMAFEDHSRNGRITLMRFQESGCCSGFAGGGLAKRGVLR
ncbi:MAG TPA: hypothetical protein VHO02_06355 [Fibrobacteria bacterium]|nr:hypothetical protein [Fibrobacteria bacterium]